MGKRPVMDVASLRRLDQQRESFRAVEAFPYSEELASVMVSDVYTVAPGELVRDVAAEMARRCISSAVVVDDAGRAAGILTEGDIMKRVVAAGAHDPSGLPVSRVMTADPATLTPRDPVFRALSLLSRKGVKHLPLVADGRVAGMVTLRQLLKLRHPEPTMLITRVEEARGVDDLRRIKQDAARVVASKLSVGLRAYEIVVMLSLLNQEIHRRAFDLCLAAAGEPPASYCLFLTGSHGRMENLLSTDQDHGMIISDTEDDRQYDVYFMDLTGRFSEMLVDIGYPWCPGYIMSANPTWRKSLREWKIQLRYWFDRQVVNLARYVTVFFDAVPLHGDSSLFDDLNEFAYGLLRTHHEVLRVLHEEEGGHRVPTGLLGRFITERSGEHKGQLDVKKSGLIFMVEGMRILALRHGVRETSTLKRISALVDGGHIHADDGEYYEAAYRFLLHYALVSQVEKVQAGRIPDTFIAPSLFSPRDREMLRHAFKAVSSLQDAIASDFGELVL